MQFWILKIAQQAWYPDVHGSLYVHDNTHSVQLKANDIFIYLDTSLEYAFTGSGRILKIVERRPTQEEAKRTAKVRRVFEAHLCDYFDFSRPLSISPTKEMGRANRALLGITDVNLLGWSKSMPRISEEWYESIMNLAQASRIIPSAQDVVDYSVPDKWGKVKVRQATAGFSKEVIDRHKGICLVCGTKVEGMVDAAHISPYTADEKNRANPANGICLCTYCHRALDRRLIAITPSGELLVAPNIDDMIARAHFSAVDFRIRRTWLTGIDPNFLNLTVKWFHECSGLNKTA